ncbi:MULTISPECIES: energy-coupling factor transporter ATPase [Anaerostipes]|uniref:Energy-coupling factor transporter ATP-binding protein EcfA1 n=1 Tax=Anaerostipes butyraticus TaxID=645466 RepID=A0A916VDG7_9FIRM|nr:MULTISPECIES: energy-coupling factor transporter ATPase [Anaerostipes]GFO85765.1 energy-coupling factor transporter ATP-binding protein EcfA1 [Anaerostipes butyraticus]HJC82781.1 energy-coupling factor transporter ATPase [Candidatus Anaerostipes avicola]
MPILNIKNLIHKYMTYDDSEKNQEIRAIDDVSFSVEKGEFIAILGRNGSGKSSLAKHINGLLLPTEGAVYVKGMDTRNQEEILQIRQSAGIVFQNPDNQIVGAVVDEDVAFGPENMGRPTEDIWRRVTKALEDVGMTAYKEASPNRLSGGQKQRIAIAGIMAMEPECIILDEPTAMLDPQGRQHVLSLVKELNQEKNITILMVTHHMEEVLLADRVIVMQEGKIAADGTPKEIFSQVEKLKKIGLEVPPAAELAYELRKEGIPLKDQIITKEELVEELCRFV